jgi:hypothetical protein
VVWFVIWYKYDPLVTGHPTDLNAAMTSLTGEEIETNLYQSMMGPKTIGKVVAFLKATGLGYRKIPEEIEISETQLAETEERIGLAVFDTGTFE